MMITGREARGRATEFSMRRRVGTGAPRGDCRSEAMARTVRARQRDGHVLRVHVDYHCRCYCLMITSPSPSRFTPRYAVKMPRYVAPRYAAHDIDIIAIAAF